MSFNLISIEEAKAIAGAPPGIVEGIISLVGRGLRSQGILEYAKAVADGKEPPALPTPGGPKPLVIQLRSFLQDPRQYSDTWGMPDDLVDKLRGLHITDPEAARSELYHYLSATPRVAQNNRAVSVVLSGMPGDSPSSAQPLANARNISKSLSAEIKSNSQHYGSYRFTAFETPLDVTRRFAVDLGSNFFACTFSKKDAVAVARIASVRGRQDPAVSPYVIYVNSAGQALSGDDISSSYWDCRRGPRDATQKSTRSPGVGVSNGPSSSGSRSAPTVVG